MPKIEINFGKSGHGILFQCKWRFQNTSWLPLLINISKCIKLNSVTDSSDSREESEIIRWLSKRPLIRSLDWLYAEYELESRR
jgi:hypothetical protein